MTLFSKLLNCFKTGFFLSGIILALFIWILDPFIDAVFLQRGIFYQQITNPDTHDLFIRSFLSTIIILFSFIGGFLMIRSKQIEESLKKRTSQLNEAQHLAQLGSWELDHLNNVLEWSDEVYSIFEIDAEKFGASYEAFVNTVHPDDREFVDNAYTDSIQNRKPYDIVHRLLMKDGRVKYINEHCKTQYGDDGKPQRSIGTVADITDRNKVEELLKESEKKYRGLLETNPDGMIIVDSKGKIEIVNAQLEKMTGYTADELIGQSVEKLIPERFKSHKQQRDSYIANPQVRMMGQRSELFVRRKDHSEFPAEISLSPMETKNGLIISVSIRDIAERKKVEDKLRKSEAMLSEAQRIANVGSWEFDPSKNKRIVSDEMCKIFDVVSEKEIDSYEDFLEIVHPEDQSRFHSVYTDATNNKEQHYDIEHRLLMKDGRVKHVHQKCENIFDENRKLTRSIGTVIDITDRKQAEAEIRKLSLSVENSPNVVMITNKEAIIEYVNPTFTEITGYTPEEAIGRNPSFFIDEKITEEAYRESRGILNSGNVWHGEFASKKKNGDVYLSTQMVFPIKDESGAITQIVSIHKDITEERKLSEQLTYHASHDDLTGLVNRREFERRAERLLSTVKQDKDEHALCFLDLDQFKVINDTCGHTAGDDMLRQLSSVLLKTVRQRDTLARLGGDEFGVLMEHCSLDDAQRVAKSLQKTIQDFQFMWEERSFKVGVSMGLVAITETTHNFTELLKDADAACYMAKDKGRNRIHVYHTEDSELAQRHGEMQWVARLHHALEEDQFCLYAQTIMPLDGSADTHYELLVRMLDEKGETIPPGAFLPAAERYNLISKLDCWVVEEAFALLAENPAFFKQINFCSINLSGQSMAASDFLNFVIAQLDKSGIDGNKICFEITETAAISNLAIANKFISTLKGLGCRFALDDFGSGLSSFAYLKNLPVDYLKIDGMFVKDIVDDPIDRAMVKSINEIGHVMGMQTIAEFVENDVIKGMLKEIGVNYAQGYGIGKPQPLYELLSRANNVTDIKDAERE